MFQRRSQPKVSGQTWQARPIRNARLSSNRALGVFTALAASLMVACGGGGGGGGEGSLTSQAPSSAALSTVAVSGQAVKGPVVGGQVCAYTLVRPRQQIACTTTDANAAYKLDVPAGTGDILIEVTGGRYIDEATGIPTVLASPLRTLTRADGSVQNLLLTPFTELAVQRVAAQADAAQGPLSLAGFQTEIEGLEKGLNLKGLTTGNPWAGTGADEKLHKKALEAFSQHQKSTSKTVQEALSAMQLELDGCNATSLAVKLEAAGSVALRRDLVAPLPLESEKQTPLPIPSVLIPLGQINAPSAPAKFVKITAFSITFDNNLPQICTNKFVADGIEFDMVDLNLSLAPQAWKTAKEVEITQCIGLWETTLDFPLANLTVHVSGINSASDYSFESSGDLKFMILQNSAVTLSAGSFENFLARNSTIGGTISVGTSSPLNQAGGTLVLTSSPITPASPTLSSANSATNALQISSGTCLNRS